MFVKNEICLFNNRVADKNARFLTKLAFFSNVVIPRAEDCCPL